MTTSISIHRSSSPVFEELTAVICRLAGNVHTDERLRCGALVSLSYLAVSSEHSFIACEKAIKIHKDETQNKNTHATRTTIRQARTETKRGSMGRKGQSDQTHATHDKQPQNDKTRKNIHDRHSTAPENRTRMDHHHRKQGQGTQRTATGHEQRTKTLTLLGLPFDKPELRQSEEAWDERDKAAKHMLLTINSHIMTRLGRTSMTGIALHQRTG